MTISIFARLNKWGWKGKRLKVQFFEELKDEGELKEVSYKMSDMSFGNCISIVDLIILSFRYPGS